MRKLSKQYSFSLTASLILALLYPQAHAEEQLNTSPEIKTLDTIVVTGTRSLKRSKTDSLQPIDVISAQELTERTGSSELGTALSKIIPSINFPRPTVVDGTELVRPVQLKGLSPDQVLVLVNGKRRHTGAFINLGGTIGRGSAPTDLNAIPVSAISRIEVLREGASARYGSDAIAGVVNIILKSDPKTGEAGIRYGIYDKGDGEQKQSYVSGGTRLGDYGYAIFSGEWQDNQATNRAGLDLRDPNATTYGQRTFRFGDPKSDEVKAAFNAGFDLSDSVELYGFSTYSHRNAETAGFYRLSNASNNVPALFPNGYLPLIRGQLDDFSAVAGLRGEAADWRYDVSANYGLNQYDVNTRTINVDLYKDTGATPNSFHNGKLKNSQSVFNIDLSKEYDISAFASPLNIAFGAQYLNQQYQIKAGDPGSYYKSGSSGLSGFRQADAGKWTRDSYAGYLDLETDITQKLSASSAYRYEKYDDFGDTNNASLSLRYQLLPQVAVRGSVSTGFRAPSLAQQYFTQTSSQLVNGQFVEAGTFPSSSQVAQLLGAEDLKAEKSKNYSLGFVFTPTSNLYVTLDAYQIDIDDRISLSSNINASSPAVRDYLISKGITNTNFSSVRFFNNASDTRTRGVDLVANYQWQNLPYGELTTSLAYNFNRNEVTNVDKNPDILNALGVNLTRLDRREQYGLLAGSTPEHKFSLANDYKIGNIGINTNITRYGSFKTFSNSGSASDQKFSAKWLLDLALSYQLKAWKFTLGGDNITNVYPDKDVYDINKPTGGSLQYSQFSPFGFNGAFYYGKINYKW
ncbi:TonB-dependent receptor; Outer membrane receptor for ferrienterochelin and colicins [Acinetobacter bereziniae]|uniref:TonB-dependent receptor plug domain-containing protein n=1 Tax=Acinetobacter bereziniae TaxID=106648 RepID=UPI0005749208|nr:TonB-dependent receptor [Acinetobacter bereziniae]CEI52372.1 TonB-dependent receptor; Outer membrane receptor for ferrienterochelin and colicins [Acinetobacter bereziniae]